MTTFIATFDTGATVTVVSPDARNAYTAAAKQAVTEGLGAGTIISIEEQA